MKRNILILFMMAMVVVTYGQKKPKVNRTLNHLEDGEVAEAKAIVDAGIEHEKTKDDAKTWYYRALVYSVIDTTSSPDYSNLADQDPLKEAVEAFSKASELNEGKNELYITGPNGLPILKSQHEQMVWSHYVNKGVSNFQNNNAEGAYQAFSRCQMVMPMDTTCTLYAGLAAQSAENWDAAAKNFYKLVNELDNHDPDIYNTLIYIESVKNKDTLKALEITRKAKEQFPDNASFARSEISLLIDLGKVEDAKEELLTTLEKDPNNADLLFALGTLYDETGELEKAIDAYKKALQADPQHFNSAYNLAVLKFNEVRDIVMKRNELDIKPSNNKKLEEYNKQIIEGFKEVAPYWETVRSIEPSNQTALEQLSYIYTQIKQKDKAEEIEKEIKKYGYDTEQ